jgi:hypothetical protein
MSSREWYSIQNKLLGSILQTFRNLNCGVIFTTPNLSFIDVQARKLFHSYFETCYLDYEKQECWMKIYDIDVNSRYDKVYFKHPIFYHDGRPTKLSHLITNKPNASILEHYEQRKTAFTQALNKKALEELTGCNKKNTPHQINTDDVIRDILRKKKTYVKRYGDRSIISLPLIRADYGLSEPVAKQIKAKIETKL